MNNFDFEYMNYANNNITSDDNFYYSSNDLNYFNNNSNAERINYMPNIDSYKIQFMNQSNQKTNNNYATKAIDISNNSIFLEPYQGFIRGNLFKNEYEGFKNYKPLDINSHSEKENLLNQLQLYNFALIDLDLYLDVNPNDDNAIKLYTNYLDIKKQIVKKYENLYGSLTLNNSVLDKNNWEWIKSPWPWEVM